MQIGPMCRRVAGLDVLRVLAILLVLVAHYPKSPGGGILTRLMNFGWTGVDLFFVLSGYLIGGQLFAAIASGRRVSLFAFYARRLLRTLPNYYVVLAVYVGLSIPAAAAAPAPLWRFLSFTQNLGIPNVFTPSWSLCVEEHFYLAFPVLALLLCRARSPKLVGAVFLVILAGGLTLRAVIWFAARPDRLGAADALATYMGQLYFPSWCRLDGITMGVGLAALKAFRPAAWQRLTAHASVLLAGSMLFLALSAWSYWTRYTFVCSTLGFTCISVSFTLLTAYVLSGRSWLASHPIPGAATIAQLSYGIYLTHSLAIDSTAWLLGGYGVKLQSIAGVAVASALMAGFACLLYYLVERPCLSLRDQLFGNRRPRVWQEPLVPVQEAR